MKKTTTTTSGQEKNESDDNILHIQKEKKCFFSSKCIIGSSKRESNYHYCGTHKSIWINNCVQKKIETEKEIIEGETERTKKKIWNEKRNVTLTQ